ELQMTHAIVPYTTLFRSRADRTGGRRGAGAARALVRGGRGRRVRRRRTRAKKGPEGEPRGQFERFRAWDSGDTPGPRCSGWGNRDRKSTRLNSSHVKI